MLDNPKSALQQLVLAIYTSYLIILTLHPSYNTQNVHAQRSKRVWQAEEEPVHVNRFSACDSPPCCRNGHLPPPK